MRQRDFDTLLNLILWAIGCATICGAAWYTDYRLGMACIGATLVWFSRPRMWGKVD